MTTEPKICRHSKIEVWEDEDGRGYFAECKVCEGCGPLKPDKAAARTALQSMRVQRPSNQGGVREGAGRKKALPDDARFVAFTLLPRHIRKIDRFIVKHNKEASDRKQIKSRSAGLRQLLEDLRTN